MKKFTLLMCLLPVLAFGQNSTSCSTQNNTCHCTCCCHNNYQMAQRSSRTIPVFAISGELKQAGVLIGTYHTEESEIDGEDVKYILYYLPNGTLAAEATVYEDQSNAVVYTYKDGHTTTISVDFPAFPEDEVAEYLATHFYL